MNGRSHHTNDWCLPYHTDTLTHHPLRRHPSDPQSHSENEASTKDKLKVLQSHYQRLGSCSVDDAFDDNWKQEVDSKVNECHRYSIEHDNPVLDREIE